MTTDRDIAEALTVGLRIPVAGCADCVCGGFRPRSAVWWERVQFSGGLRSRTLEMGDLFEPDAVRACAALWKLRRLQPKPWLHGRTKGTITMPYMMMPDRRKLPATRCRNLRFRRTKAGPRRPDTGSPDKDNL